jgi:hypothetical protein
MNVQEVDNWDQYDLSHLDRLLIEAYRRTAVTLDRLPYTEDFERLLRSVNELRSKQDHQFTNEERAQMFRRLSNLRKSGRLPSVYLATPRNPPSVPIPEAG